jgi:hypothetical protein
MVECPRCGGRVEQLHRLPAEALAGPAAGRSGSDARTSDHRACRWCLHELTEG